MAPNGKMGQERFLVIAVTKGNPHSDGTVFESQDGVRLVVAAAGPDTQMHEAHN